METQSITIEKRVVNKLYLSDLDNDNEIELNIEHQNKSMSIIYLDKHDLINIKNHINYLLKKL